MLQKAIVDQQEFARALTELTPRPWVSFALIGVNVVVFILMVLFGVGGTRPTLGTLIAWGAEFGPRTMAGEWWRLFSSQFVHASVLHLVGNLIAFGYVAFLIERMVGNVDFLLLFLVSGLGGAMLALLFDPTLVHAGASGAIFGLYGTLLVFVIVQARSIPPRVASWQAAFAIIFLALNLAGSVKPGISLSAHAGGLATGIVCGLILAQPLSATSLRGRRLRGVAVLFLGLVILGVGRYMAVQYSGLDRLDALLERFRVLDAQDDAIYSKARDDNVPNDVRYAGELDRRSQDHSKQLSDEAFAGLLESNLLPAWRPLCKDFESFAAVPQRYQSDFQAIVDYAEQRQQEWELLAQGLRDGNQQKISKAKELYWKTSDARQAIRYGALKYLAAD